MPGGGTGSVRPPAAARPGFWAAWRRWRRSRPFWGGLAAVVAGAEICAIPLAPLKIMLEQGIAGIPGVLMGLVMIVMGLSAWFAPQYRGLAGVLTVLVATATLVMSNLGGFLFGTVVGVVGGAMIFAWTPLEPAPEPAGAPLAEPPVPTPQAHAQAPTQPGRTQPHPARTQAEAPAPPRHLPPKESP
ncbi:hypothetical protein BLA24_21905 [Streptomyces cinnamoneus]|uniref:Uncharacterized protein n=2 Tax=Streptomyces cinnamoneus TaxID=53446 RepID=A0A2G1XG74_STRCJ|nr:hypothetical protein BLA24_21905 [Streptomyces cinnamoneus]PPT12989.1 hypothetical protein CYQ11_08880 [Streptomyces cinnamoneus]